MGQVEWQEGRQHELFIVVGELLPTGWNFFERSSFEVRWFPVPATDAMKAKADALLTLASHAARS